MRYSVVAIFQSKLGKSDACVRFPFETDSLERGIAIIDYKLNELQRFKDEETCVWFVHQVTFQWVE